MTSHALHDVPLTSGPPIAPAVTASNVVYSDRFFRFRQPLTSIVLQIHWVGYNSLSLQLCEIPLKEYMPFIAKCVCVSCLNFLIHNMFKVDSESGKQSTDCRELPMINYVLLDHLTVIQSSLDSRSNTLHVTNDEAVTTVVHRDTRNVLSRVSVLEGNPSEIFSRSTRWGNQVSFAQKSNIISPMHSLKYPIYNSFSSKSEKCTLPPKNKELGGYVHYKDVDATVVLIPEQRKKRLVDVDSETQISGKSSEISSSYGMKGSEEVDYDTSGSSRSIMTDKKKKFRYPGSLQIKTPKKLHSSASRHVSAQDEMSISVIESYPLPEPPSLLLLEPLLLMQDVKKETKTRKRKAQLTPSEQQKVARIMISYALAFFLLAIVTFYVVYFA